MRGCSQVGFWTRRCRIGALVPRFCLHFSSSSFSSSFALQKNELKYYSLVARTSYPLHKLYHGNIHSSANALSRAELARLDKGRVERLTRSARFADRQSIWTTLYRLPRLQKHRLQRQFRHFPLIPKFPPGYSDARLQWLFPLSRSRVCHFKRGRLYLYKTTNLSLLFWERPRFG